jgi:hypothetical protein
LILKLPHAIVNAACLIKKTYLTGSKGYFNMLPEHLVPSRFHLSTSQTNTDTAENSESLAQGTVNLSDYEADILISASATGQARNMLFEECDRHLKERLFSAAKIESFTRLLNSLQAEGDINAQELSKILAKNTALINEQGNKIWLNLITRETSAPIFYSLEDK